MKDKIAREEIEKLRENVMQELNKLWEQIRLFPQKVLDDKRLLDQINKVMVDNKKQCEICGCLVGNNAVKGRDEVRLKINKNTEIEYNFFPEYEKYIYTPYYCRKCAPVNDKKETNTLLTPKQQSGSLLYKFQQVEKNNKKKVKK